MKLIKFEQNDCVPCKMLREFMDGLGVKADKVVNLTTATEMEDFMLAGKHDIDKTPVLLIEDDNGNEIARYKGVGQTGVKAILAQRGLI
ncbi:thioredoxin [Bacillus sp. CH_203]|uniref:thioredoxin n=1 Tax=Bacillus sp. CH_203 TaxID=2978216 RepID=UPI0030F9DA15|nr:thioredoxin [Bacillus cereus]